MDNQGGAFDLLNYLRIQVLFKIITKTQIGSILLQGTNQTISFFFTNGRDNFS